VEEQPWVTVQSIAESLGCDPRIVKGFALGMGIRLIRVSNGDSMAIRDSRRVKEGLERQRYPRIKKRRKVASS
jgi:hypothetical protein